jgi:TadE-like protein
MARRLRSLRQTGQAATEFALIALIFFGLMCGIIDFGRGIWYYNTLSNATREGARYASVIRMRENGDLAVADCNEVRNQVQDLGLGLGLPLANIGVNYFSSDTNVGALVPVNPGDCPTWVPASDSRPKGYKLGTPPLYYVSVSARYDFHLITPLIANVIGNGGVIPLRSDSMMMASF